MLRSEDSPLGLEHGACVYEVGWGLSGEETGKTGRGEPWESQMAGSEVGCILRVVGTRGVWRSGLHYRGENSGDTHTSIEHSLS